MRDEELILIIGVVVLITYAVMYGVVIVFLLSLSKLLHQIAPRNRRMEPGEVWLNLIPCFCYVWNFITVLRVAESLRDEYRDRGMDYRVDDYGQSLGITTCVLNVCQYIPYLGSLLYLGAFVCFIIYWVKIAGYKRDLAESPSYRDEDDRDYRRRYDDEDDDRDDRPRRKPRREDDDRDDRDRDDRDRDDDRDGGYKKRYE